MEFLLCVLQYLLILIVLVAIGIIGAKIGIHYRKKKDLQEAMKAAMAAANQNQDDNQ